MSVETLHAIADAVDLPRLTSWAFTTAAIGTGVWVGGIVGTWLGWWS